MFGSMRKYTDQVDLDSHGTGSGRECNTIVKYNIDLLKSTRKQDHFMIKSINQLDLQLQKLINNF